MQVQIHSATQETIFFAILFLNLIFVTLKRARGERAFNITLTNELKGLAIFSIIFGHIGYFLANDPTFLYPFSIISGVGVNLFLFLSGFGLTLSHIKNPLSPLKFYLKRLKKIFVPMWIVLIFLYILDFVLLQRTYPLASVVQSFFGFFPQANLYIQVDSPLWYFTFILGYYLLFPILFWRRWPYLSVLLFMIVGWFITQLPIPVNPDVLTLYKIHIFAFPLGVLFATAVSKNLFQGITKKLNTFYLLTGAVLLTIIFAYTSIHSGVGTNYTIEQLISIITMFSLIGLAIIKRLEFSLFRVFGEYSYEIYLIHWPLLYRYDLLYKALPSSLATFLYLFVFLGVAYGLRKITDRV